MTAVLAIGQKVTLTNYYRVSSEGKEILVFAVPENQLNDRYIYFNLDCY